MSRFVNPIPQFILENGDLAAGGTISFYKSGTNEFLEIFADVNETIPIANPITLGSRGEVPNVFYSQSARAVLEDADGVQIFDVDPVGGTAATGEFQIWDSNVVYEQLDIAYGSNGLPYVSIANNNQGNDPTLNANNNQFWTKLVVIEDWNAQYPYGANDIVYYEGFLYRSVVEDNIGIDPATDDSTNWVSIANAQ